jgi:cytochrome c peroxidase
MLLRDGEIPPSYNSAPTGVQASYTAGFIPPLPIGNTQPPDRIGNHGAFKVAQLRNVELTGPFMHNGGMATLRQVVDFYTRGGNFDQDNLADLDPLIAPIGRLIGLPSDKNDLVSFLMALTDNRVRNELEPFDHPELIVPHGTTVTGIEITFTVPAVGRDGRPGESPPLPPLQSFLNVNQFTP